jgi:hypothetical protein
VSNSAAVAAVPPVVPVLTPAMLSGGSRSVRRLVAHAAGSWRSCCTS